MTTTYEVELKYRLRDSASLIAELQALGGTASGAAAQCDLYFAHPARDFRQTDEALRLRAIGEANCITYKGPVVDPLAKTRQEIEISFAEGSGEFQRMGHIFTLLGFRAVRKVEKFRRTWQLPWEGTVVEVALDEVPPLGLFVELELQATNEARSTARDSLLRLATRLQLAQPEKKSYLQLLLESDTVP